jgi:hypothetical protein
MHVLSLRTLRSIVYLATLSLVILSLTLSSNTQASPFLVGRFNGLVGGPLNQSPFAIYWNPANLDRVGKHVHFYLGMIARQATYDRDLPEDTPAEIADVNGGLATNSSFGAVPSLALQMGDTFSQKGRWGVGIAAYVARAGVAGWDRHPDASTQYPGSYDGPQRWSSISTRMALINYALGSAIGYGPFSFGVSLNYVNASLSLAKASNVADKSDDVIDANGNLKEGRIFLNEAQGSAFHVIAGMRLDLKPIHLALSWRQNVVYDLIGKTRIISGSTETQAQVGVELQVAGNLLTSLAFDATPTLVLRAEFEYQPWSIMDQQVIRNVDNGSDLLILERYFVDTMAYRLRVDWQMKKNFTWHIGISYEEAATLEEYHEAGLAENDFIEPGLGISWQFHPQVLLHSSLLWQHFFDRTVTNSKQKPQGNGKYTDQRQYATLDLIWSF